MNLSVDTWSQDKLDARKKEEENLLLQQTSSWNIRLGLAAAATCYLLPPACTFISFQVLFRVDVVSQANVTPNGHSINITWQPM